MKISKNFNTNIMDKKYFIASGKDHLGPFSLSELHGKKLNPDTQIWSEDLGKWTKVTEIAELKDYVISVPPPTPESIEIQIKRENKKVKQNITYKLLQKVTIYTIAIFIFYLIVIFAVLGGFNSDFNSDYYNNYDRGIRLYVANIQQLRTTLGMISLFWSFIFSVIFFVLFFIREKIRYSD